MQTYTLTDACDKHGEVFDKAYLIHFTSLKCLLTITQITCVVSSVCER
ncbi:hypothetical protein SAMD00079811_09470 [Scytonema sp. HK-05]|nr:hypothetical protein SAMD00079811_09470 [Scytonema sp. HK-05]